MGWRKYCLTAALAAVVTGVIILAVNPSEPTGPTQPGAALAQAQPPPAFRAMATRALRHYLAGHHPGPAGLRSAVASPTRTGPSTVSSFSWSGYADVAARSRTFTQASGTWTLPAVTCSPEDQLALQWAGLGGYNASDAPVEQAGSLGWCYQGKAVYDTWYQMYPGPTVEVGTAALAGDRVHASVSRTGTAYTLTVTDATHPAASFTKTANCGATVCLDTSAEWINERPTLSIGVAPLASYGTWTLTNASETADGKTGSITGFPISYQISMMDATQHYQLSTASALNKTGGTFTTTWLNSY